MKRDPPPPPMHRKISVLAYRDRRSEHRSDRATVEEPLEIRLVAGGESRPVAVTMRTPGQDDELALGFLFAERILTARDEVTSLRPLDDPWGTPGEPSNVLEVELASGELPDLVPLERHFFASSACGVCGRAGIESLRLSGVEIPAGNLRIAAERLCTLPDRLRSAQGTFQATGGLHAAGLFDRDGELVALREDVGRHNAVDKLIGWALGEGRLPLADGIVLVSGRSSFEIVQKCAVAGVPLVASVSAPSTLAVELAGEVGMTLIGFLRGGRFNVYSTPERVELAG